MRVRSEIHLHFQPERVKKKKSSVFYKNIDRNLKGCIWSCAFCGENWASSSRDIFNLRLERLIKRQVESAVGYEECARYQRFPSNPN